MRNRDELAPFAQSLNYFVDACPKCGSDTTRTEFGATETFECASDACGWSFDRDIPRYIGDPITEEES